MLIDTKQIAQLLSVSRDHVTDRLTKRADFPAPAVNISQKLRRWEESDVIAWLRRQSKRAAMSSADSL